MTKTKEQQTAPSRGCFKMAYSKNLFIAAIKFQNFETSIARVLKQALVLKVFHSFIFFLLYKP
jgi:hypothetical protein